jgi:hypothetical protein
MKTLVRTLILSFFVTFTISTLPVYAAKSFNSEAVKKSGENVYLFDSGSQNVKKEFCQNDIIPVYRDVFHSFYFKGIGMAQSVEQVASIKILSYEGDRYFNAQVLNGVVAAGDVATKVGANCPVIPAM